LFENVAVLHESVVVLGVVPGGDTTGASHVNPDPLLLDSTTFPLLSSLLMVTVTAEETPGTPTINRSTIAVINLCHTIAVLLRSGDCLRPIN
jgi:hypothetical protein